MKKHSDLPNPPPPGWHIVYKKHEYVGELVAPKINKTWKESFAAWLRAHLWGFVFGMFSDGVTTKVSDKTIPLASKPPVPQGKLIIVANHSSHADSAAISATIGRCRPLLFAAAADYWWTSKIKRVAGQMLMGIWPVRRSHGLGDLLAAEEVINNDTILVVYPEGTRGKSASGGPLGEFHKGVFLLAEKTGASILPISILGTSKVLPAHEPLSRAPVELRWGNIIPAGEPQKMLAETRKEIETNLTPSQITQTPGRAYSRVTRLAYSTWGLLVLFGWAFFEGISWPLIAELPLLLVVLTARGWRGPLLIASTVIGSVSGILTTWFLITKIGIHPPSPLTTAKMHEEALRQINLNPVGAFWSQMRNGIPVKVYAAATGDAGMTSTQVLISIWPRILRIVVWGGLGWILGILFTRYLKPFLGILQALALILFPLALWWIYKSWI